MIENPDSAKLDEDTDSSLTGGFNGITPGGTHNSALVEQLTNDVAKLKQALEEEKSTSKQAAEYGLSLLEEFKKLQNKNYELEGEIETCRAEIDTANSELSKVKKTKKLADAKDQSLEHNLLVESADREEKLSSRLNTVELELGKAKQELERVYNENERLLIAQQETQAHVEQLKDSILRQKSEIKSLKERENRLLVDNTELDGENVQLQEQIVKLKEDLVELDTTKHENRALNERLDMQAANIAEINTLKRILEKQLEESLNSIREEREHKYQKKRESHERREKQSLQELQNIAKNLSIDYDDVDYDDYDNRVEVHHGQFVNPMAAAGTDKNSLMNEIQTVDELQRLEAKLAELGKHKDQMESELVEFKSDLNLMIESIHGINKRLPSLNPVKSTDGLQGNELELYFFISK
jgi:protein bicaudal D